MSTPCPSVGDVAISRKAPRGFRLGARRSAGPRPSKRAKGSLEPERGLADIRVLVVEDDSLVAMDLVTILEDLGAEVCGMAARGDEAVQKARSLRPQLAIVDVRLRDGETGIDAARVMAEDLGVAVVFATAHSDPGLAGQMASVPGAVRLAKPYDARALAEATRQVLGRAQLRGR